MFSKSPSDIILKLNTEVAKWQTCLPAGRRATMMFYVYILKSRKTEEYYKGITNNLPLRISQHLSGKSPTTKSKLPLVLIHVEICDSRAEARKLEKFFKSGYGREIIDEIAPMLEW